MKKRVLAILLAICMFMCSFPMTAIAVDEPQTGTEIPNITITAEDDLAQKINEISGIATVTISEDITLSEKVTIDEGDVITLQPSGAVTITLEKDASFSVAAGGTLNLGEGMGAENTLTIDGGAVWPEGSPVNQTNLWETQYVNNVVQYTGTARDDAMIQVAGTLAMYDGVTLQNVCNQKTNGYNGGAVKVESTGSFIMHGGLFQNNLAANGGAIALSGGATFEMKAGKFTGNAAYEEGSSSTSGGAIYSNKSKVTIWGGTFDNNRARGQGGGLYAEGKPDDIGDAPAIYVEKAVFSKNCAYSRAGQGGGGAYLKNTAAQIDNAEFLENVAGNTGQTHGGGIYVTGSTLTMTGTKIKDNDASLNATSEGDFSAGGGLFSKSSIITMNGCEISGNESTGRAGGLYLEDSNTYLAETKVENNICHNTGYYVYGGGGIYIAVKSGGSIGSPSGTTGVTPDANVLELYNSTVSGNTSETPTSPKKISKGGGLCIQGGDVILSGTTKIHSNTAESGYGGGIMLGNGMLKLTGDASVTDNTASGGGNGIYVVTGKTFGVQDDAVIDKGNDVALESGAYITVSDKFDGATTENPVNITSQDAQIESKDSPDTTPGTKLVYYTAEAGGEDAANAAEMAQLFVPSGIMLATNPNFYIGKSMASSQLDYLAYIEKPTFYTVTFDQNGGDTEADPVSMKTKAGSALSSLPAEPQRTAYDFTGWNTAADGTGTAFTASTPVTADITVYAQWKQKPVENPDSGASSKPNKKDYYILRYESNDGTEYEDERYREGRRVELDKLPERENYQFTGWYADEELTKPITEVVMNRSKTVYAGWRIDTVPGMLNGDDHFAYIVGFNDGTVRPQANISRAEVATIFFRLLDPAVRDRELETACTYLDVPAGLWCRTPIATMTKLGILSGRSAEKYDPNAPITRAEFAAIASRFDESNVEIDCAFRDIAGNWAEDEIKRAASLGWLAAFRGEYFQPDLPITRAEVMSIINRMLIRLPETEDDLLDDMRIWPDNLPGTDYYLDVQEATNSHEYKHKGEIHETWIELTSDPDWSRYK